MERFPRQFIIRRGDQYSLPFTVILGNYFFLESEIEKIQVTVEDCLQKHLYITRDSSGTVIGREGEIRFDSVHNTFNMPISQQESFAFSPNETYKTEVKVKVRQINQGDTPYIYSFPGPDIFVEDSISENLLTF